MVYVEYYIKNAKLGRLQEMCGDRSVYILDGRTSQSTMIEDSKTWAKKNNKIATHGKLFKGSSFTQAVGISEYFKLK